jgi:abhydrolase domain-containing protein 17
MGGVVGSLVTIYCYSGCQGTLVASALAFHPPPPQYSLDFDEGTKTYTFLLDGVKPPIPVSATMISTSTNSKIPIICIRSPGARMSILFSHGNATDLGAMFGFFAAVSKVLGVNVIAYDYTGYGVSELGPDWDERVRTTEKQVYLDAEAAYAWAVANVVKDAGKELVLYGQSVGSGPSVYLASKKETPVAGLVLHSPILSGLRVLTHNRLMSCFDIFPNVDRIGKVSAPVFVMHGEQDMEVDVSHGKGLHDKVPTEFQTPPWWVRERGHNDIIMNNDREFFK